MHLIATDRSHFADVAQQRQQPRRGGINCRARLPCESASLSIGSISASVVKLLSSSASNGESAGGPESFRGCRMHHSRRVSPTTRDAPFRPERVLADCHQGGNPSRGTSLRFPSLGSAGQFGMSTGRASRASVLTSACLRASGASPRHSASLCRRPACARSSKRTVRLISGVALDQCCEWELYRTACRF